MGLKSELEAYAKRTHDNVWERRAGRKVPATDEIVATKNDGVDLDATILYADLAGSTALVETEKDWFAAEIYKNYLYCASRIIRERGGVVTAFDGDRVMGVFIGATRSSDAAKAGLQITWTVRNVIQPALEAKYPRNGYVVRQRVGIDDSKVMAARTGIRGTNDLVWVGRAANRAAKLAALHGDYSTFLTSTVYERMMSSAKVSSDGRDMWTSLGEIDGIGVYGSRWGWVVS